MLPDLPAVRALLPCLSREVYLNTGGTGPLPIPAADALAAWARRAPAIGRGGAAAEREMAAEADALRADVAALLGADPGEVALSGNTTQAVGTVVTGLALDPGDEIVTTCLEHPGLAGPLAAAADRCGGRLRVLGMEASHGDLERAVGEVAGPRTRLVALSHVSYCTGAVLDVAGAARAARAAGALTLVDGAQAVGAIPVDPRALGADAYALPAHKWLLGPEGLGALWVRPEALERIGQAVPGFASGAGHRPDGRYEPHAGARRYEASTPPAALLPAWRAALEWLAGLGWGWIHRRVREAQAAARDALAGLPGVEVLTPPGPQAGLVAFTAPGSDPAAACERLARGGVTVRWLAHPPALRASAGFFTDASDVERLRAGVAALSGC